MGEHTADNKDLMTTIPSNVDGINVLNWLDAAIEREATPKTARQETVAVFAKKWNIDESTYYWQMRKPDNEKRVLQLCLSQAKKGTPEILEKLREKAEGGDTKAIEMFLKFIVQLAEKTDITSGGERIVVNVPEAIAIKYALTQHTK